MEKNEIKKINSCFAENYFKKWLDTKIQIKCKFFETFEI